MNIPEERKLIARAAIGAFGGTMKVVNYLDDSNSESIDILSSCHSPAIGLTSFSTVGLSEHNIGFEADNLPLCIELVASCAAEFSLFPNILATCAFNIINSNYTCYPGAVFPDVIKMYYPDKAMRHLLFISPILWDGKLKTLDLSEKKVAWLLGIPISDNEFAYAKKKGTEALEALLEKRDIDMFDLDRLSVL
ncbi:MAG: suppressor of fused domain protein [Clostridia bacterium]|nr:suppressor of fused domain protein [Clostridia bacterium]